MTFLHRLTVPIRVFLLTASLGGLCVAMPATAQFGQGQGGFQAFGDASTPEFSRRDLPTMVRILKLDDTQQALAQAFLDGYESSFRAQSEKFRDQMNRLREEMEQSVSRNEDWRARIEPFRALMAEARQQREQLGAEFISNVKSVLHEDQAQHWPVFERAMRRQQAIPRGLISGERVDLFRIIEGLRLDEAQRSPIDPVLSEYDVQLDQALQAREADMSRAETEMRDAMQAMDFDKGLKAIERQRKLRVRIRDINEMFATQIEPLTPDPQAFRKAYREAAYPTVYGETYGQQVFKAALAMEYADPSAKAAVESLAQQFETMLAAKNEQLQRIVREHEPKAIERQIEMIRARMEGGNVDQRSMRDDPIRTAMNERSDFERDMMTQLRALLTEEQVAALPRPSRRPDAGGGRGGLPAGLGGGMGGGGFPGGGGRGGEGRGGGGRGGDGGGRGGDGGGRGGGQATSPLDERGFPRGLVDSMR